MCHMHVETCQYACLQTLTAASLIACSFAHWPVDCVVAFERPCVIVLNLEFVFCHFDNNRLNNLHRFSIHLLNIDFLLCSRHRHPVAVFVLLRSLARTFLCFPDCPDGPYDFATSPELLCNFTLSFLSASGVLGGTPRPPDHVVNVHR